MAAAFQTPGVQGCWIVFRSGSQSQPSFVGTCVTAPEYQEEPSYIPVFSDTSGRSKPGQLIYDGTTALVSVTLSRVDLGVVSVIRDAANRTGGFSTGSDAYLSRGAAVLGVSDFSLVFSNQFFGTPQASAGLNAGRKYFACTMEGYKESAAGTRSMEIAMIVRAWSIWGGPGNGFTCFTEDPSQFGTLTPG